MDKIYWLFDFVLIMNAVQLYATEKNAYTDWLNAWIKFMNKT